MTLTLADIYYNLIELHKHEDSDEVHEGGVELEGDIGGADVVGAGHHPLHAQGKTHRKVESILARNPKFFLGKTQYQSQQYLHLINLLDPFVLLKKRLKLELLKEDNAHKEQSKDTVTKVAEHMVEVADKTQRFPGQE